MVTKVKESPSEQGPETKGSPLISNEKLQLLYTTMLKCRMLQERAGRLFAQGKIAGNYDSVVGLEAAAAGVAIDLRPEDTLAPSHRDLITSFIKGIPLGAIFCQLYARADSPDKGHSAPGYCGYAPLNIISPSANTAAQLNIANGAALANKLKRNDNIVVTFSADTSSSLEFWHEALNFAAIHDLAIIFVVQNDLLPGSASKPHSGIEGLSAKAQAYGIPGIPVDGNDVVAVHRVAQESMARARHNGGPTLIECKTFDVGGSSPKSGSQSKKDDPLSNMERYLTGKGLFRKQRKQERVSDFAKELDAAVELAEKSPLAEAAECLDQVYSFDIRDRQINAKHWTPKY